MTSKTIRRSLAALALAAGALTAAPALAQLSAGGGPIDITADELELVDAQHLAIWRGDVEALQGKNRMRADQINIYFAGQGGSSSGAPGRNWGAVQRIEANGKVFFVSPEQTARGDRGVYEMASQTITMTGQVIIAQGQSVVRGERLVIDVRTGKATMGSSSRAAGRVRGVFYPNNSSPGVAAPERRR